MKELSSKLRKFIDDRDWEQFHSPKNLAMALSVEASEIAEIFQWKNENESLDSNELKSLEQEIGDVMIYLIELSNKFIIDPVEAAKKKLALNEKKYPANLVRGKANKYSDYK